MVEEGGNGRKRKNIERKKEKDTKRDREKKKERKREKKEARRNRKKQHHVQEILIPPLTCLHPMALGFKRGTIKNFPSIHVTGAAERT